MWHPKAVRQQLKSRRSSDCTQDWAIFSEYELNKWQSHECFPSITPGTPFSAIILLSEVTRALCSRINQEAPHTSCAQMGHWMAITFQNKVPSKGPTCLKEQTVQRACIFSIIKWHPLQHPYLGSPVDRRAWQATVPGVTESDMTGRTSTHAHNSRRVYYSIFKHKKEMMCVTVGHSFLELLRLMPCQTTLGKSR